MAQQHTPGPWRNCQPSSNFEKGHAVIKDSDGKTIASITKNFKFGENMANAQLITAAPDMAEALKDVANLLHEYGDKADLDYLCDKARAALAKAGVS